MGYYKNISCPNCGRSLSGGYRRAGVENNLGLPLVQCSKCNSYSRTNKNIWSKMNKGEKREYIISQLEQSGINGIAITLFMLLIANAKYGVDIKAELMSFIVYGQLISAVLTVIFDIRLIRKLERLYREGDYSRITL